MLFHVVSATSNDPVADYRTIRSELKAQNLALLEKTEYLIISKTDAVAAERLAEVTHELSRLGLTSIAISIYNPDQVAAFKAFLDRLAHKN